MTDHLLRGLAFSGTATALAAALGSTASAAETRSAWYLGLRKPSFQPPGVVFPIVWTALYTDIAVTSARAMRDMEPEERRSYERALLANLTLNAAWSWVFFRAHRTRDAVLVAAALAISAGDLRRRVGRVRSTYARALAPYPVWCAFATVLAARLHELNERR